MLGEADRLARFLDLSWELLEHKCRYYMFSNPIINDYAYDKLEKEYEALALDLGKPPSATDMVDFDVSRPSCRRVYDRIYALQAPVKGKKRARNSAP